MGPECKYDPSIHDSFEKSDCTGCRIRKKLKHVKETSQQFEEYEAFEHVCIDGSGKLPIEGFKGEFYVCLVMCLKTRWTFAY